MTTTVENYLSSEIEKELLRVTNGKRNYGALMRAANHLPSLREFVSEQLMQQIMYDAPEPSLTHNGKPVTIAEVYDKPEQFDELYNLLIVKTVDSLFANPLKQ